jgi:hypothetical protein
MPPIAPMLGLGPARRGGRHGWRDYLAPLGHALARPSSLRQTIMRRFRNRGRVTPAPVLEVVGQLPFAACNDTVSQHRLERFDASVGFVVRCGKFRVGWDSVADNGVQTCSISTSCFLS